ncbi:MAG: DUF1850 domain-containing protein [Armatimonadetes bacterium]|nr:DUF1850 domain-containing protein [Armatimonadota bacterium]
MRHAVRHGRLSARRILVGAGAAVLLAAALAAARPGGLVLEAVDLDGDRTLVREPVSPGSTFALRYRHSIYDAPAWEWYEVLADGRMRLRRIASSKEAVLEYYRLSVPIIHRDDLAVAEVMDVVVPHVVLRVGRIGQQRLVIAGGKEIPLSEHAGDGSRVLLRLRRLPSPAGRLWHALTSSLSRPTV